MSRPLRNPICFALAVACVLCLASGCSFLKEQPVQFRDDGRFRWVGDENDLLLIEVEGNTVRLYYEFCFENTLAYGIEASFIVVNFSIIDTWGWLKYERSYDAKNLDGSESCLYVPAGTRKSTVFVFEGEYLGGPVNDSIEIQNLVFLQY